MTVGGLVTDAGVAALRDYPALSSAAGADTLLSLSSARTLTDAALAAVGTLQGLAALDVHKSAFGSPHYTARGVSHLSRLQALEWLNFNGGLAGDEALHEIAAIPRLRWLHCQDIVSGTEGFLALGACRTLEWFAARVCPRLTDRGFAAVARLPQLKSLDLGGPRVSDAALAHLEGATALTALTPIGFGDAAFEHIARIPNLTHLTNMYNRSSGDGATRHLEGHRTLVDYSAFGTQITDDSLRALAGIPTIERVGLENCWWVTDAGLRALAALPRLRAVSAWSCTSVRGDWTAAMPPGVEARSEAGPSGHALAYRAETLLDHPELAADDGLLQPTVVPGTDVPLVYAGGTPEVVGNVLHFAVASGSREAGLVTRDAYRLPARLEIEVRPMTALRLFFLRHNRMLALDELGFPVDLAPWFLRTSAEAGVSHRTGAERQVGPGEWARITLDIGRETRELRVNGELRHSWTDDMAGLRSRFGIAVRGTEMFIRSLRIIETGGV